MTANIGPHKLSTIVTGDCLGVLRTLPDNSIDTLITDPPAGISFMGKKWDSNKGGRDRWIEWLTARLSECRRVLKPGAMALVWAIPRTSHWTGMALENAGFEIRDQIYHLFGSGMPKSLDISKATGEREWDGWGTAFKPAAEVWWLAMKPLDGTFASNALEWGVAGLNIDECRIPATQQDIEARLSRNGTTRRPPGWFDDGSSPYRTGIEQGRWPANVIFDEQAAVMLDKISGEIKPHGKPANNSTRGGMFGNGSKVEGPNQYTDLGGASRFFYCTKASKNERSKDGQVDNNHPTVKPLELMEYLCKLTSTPTGGIVLDPFAGSGTTCIAALRTGRQFIGIELDLEVAQMARERIANTQIGLGL